MVPFIILLIYSLPAPFFLFFFTLDIQTGLYEPLSGPHSVDACAIHHFGATASSGFSVDTREI